MTQLISVPCKKGYEIKFIESITKYVRETYGEEQFNIHKSAFNEFNNMRSKMLNKLFDKYESTITVLTKYYDQFVAIESKIPIQENGIRIDFKWDDAFGKESLFGKKNSLQIASGGYEKTCVLFNIAAIYSQVAETQNLSDDNGLKNAARYFQQAAGIFSLLKATTSEIIEREPTSDLNVDTLSTLSSLMIAQAQELIFIKSARDHMKEANVAKIAQQTADLYTDTLKLMQLTSVKSIWPKEWIPLIADKQNGYHAQAEYFQSKACGSNHGFGEQVARLKKASELMKVASARSGPKFLFRSEHDRIKKELETAEKENNVIYHETVPGSDSLASIQKAILARELPLENPINKDFKDLFLKIIPLALMSSVTMFQNKQKAMIKSEVFKLKEATNTLGGILASLNVPAIFEESKGDEIPRALLEKAAAIRKEGGIEKIDQMKNMFPEAWQRNNDLLKEANQMMNEEEEADKKLKAQFKERWTRTPSNKLTDAWRGEWTKFNYVLQQAKSSDAFINENYQKYNAEIRILSQNESAIKESLPKSGSKHDSSVSPIIKHETKKVYEEIQAMEVTRDALIVELNKSEQLDLANQFSKSLTIDNSSEHEKLADEQINKVLEPFHVRVQQSLDVQDKLLVILQDKCLNWTENSASSASRASVISSLMLAADKYRELCGNVQEGLKFYDDFSVLLIKFENKVKDFCFARKTEKEELMKDLQSTMVKERSDIGNPGANIQATSAGTGGENRTMPNSYPQQPMPANYPPGPNNYQPMMTNYPPNVIAPNMMTTQYRAGMPLAPYPQYGHQNPSQPGPHNMAPGNRMPQYPSGYNYPSYPGNNPYPPR